MFWLDSVKWSLSSLICEQTNDGGCYTDDYPRYRQAQKYIIIYLYAYRQAQKYIIRYLYAYRQAQKYIILYRQAHTYIIIYRHTNSRNRMKNFELGSELRRIFIRLFWCCFGILVFNYFLQYLVSNNCGNEGSML